MSRGESDQVVSGEISSSSRSEVSGKNNMIAGAIIQKTVT